MISTPDRLRAVELIQTAMAAGATQAKACKALGLSSRTYQRWTSPGNGPGRWPSQRAAPGTDQ
jgi:putative transposase